MYSKKDQLNALRCAIADTEGWIAENDHVSPSMLQRQLEALKDLHTLCSKKEEKVTIGTYKFGVTIGLTKGEQLDVVDRVIADMREDITIAKDLNMTGGDRNRQIRVLNEIREEIIEGALAKPRVAITLVTEDHRGDHGTDIAVAKHFVADEPIEKLIERCGLYDPKDHLDIRIVGPDK